MEAMLPAILAGAGVVGVLWYLIEGRHPGVFVSFASEDANIRDLLIGQSKHPESKWRVRDRSLHEPFSSSWKTQTREIIRGSAVVVLLIGKATYKADGATWEVETAIEEGIPVFGIRNSKQVKGRVPACMKGCKVISWSQEGIAKQIALATGANKG